MENLADIAEPQVLPNEQKDEKIKKNNFPSVYSVSIGEIAFLRLKPE